MVRGSAIVALATCLAPAVAAACEQQHHLWQPRQRVVEQGNDPWVELGVPDDGDRGIQQQWIVQRNDVVTPNR
jgi:hypothetical protein